MKFLKKLFSKSKKLDQAEQHQENIRFKHLLNNMEGLVLKSKWI